MSRLISLLIICFCAACSSSQPSDYLTLKKQLASELKEISGITAVKTGIWVITDKPHARVYKVDYQGNVTQKVKISNAEATDVEAVTSDESHLYIGDVGDNNGDREERQIIKVPLTSLGSSGESEASGEVITFTFPDEGVIGKKKKNNFDCESLLSFKDSLYVFTKDREDKETRLYSLPNTAGNHVARYINSFNSKGLVTDAAINASGNEVVLTGYLKGHHYPFMIVFNNFKGNDFFSGDHKRINLADEGWDWQVEGITYAPDGKVYFSCEGTEEVPATLYGIKRDNLFKLDKKPGKSLSAEGEKRKKDKSGITTKGHLKI